MRLEIQKTRIALKTLHVYELIIPSVVQMKKTPLAIYNLPSFYFLCTTITRQTWLKCFHGPSVQWTSGFIWGHIWPLYLCKNPGKWTCCLIIGLENKCSLHRPQTGNFPPAVKLMHNSASDQQSQVGPLLLPGSLEYSAAPALRPCLGSCFYFSSTSYHCDW